MKAGYWQLGQGLVAAIFAGALASLAADAVFGQWLGWYVEIETFLRSAWLMAWPILGFTAGFCIDAQQEIIPRQAVARLGWMCWGAAIAFCLLMILTQLPAAFIPGIEDHEVFVPILFIRLTILEAGFLSIPAALLAGAVFGWFLGRGDAKMRS